MRLYGFCMRPLQLEEALCVYYLLSRAIHYPLVLVKPTLVPGLRKQLRASMQTDILRREIGEAGSDYRSCLL
jgi:hypothetical protein